MLFGVLPFSRRRLFVWCGLLLGSNSLALAPTGCRFCGGATSGGVLCGACLPHVEQATRDLAGHPMAGAVHDLPARTALAMQQSVQQLDQAVRQSPTGSPELQRTLDELGTRFAEVAQRAGTAGTGPGDRQAPGSNPARPASGAIGATLNQLSQDVRAIARRAAGAFGAASGALGAVDNVGRIADGTRRRPTRSRARTPTRCAGSRTPGTPRSRFAPWPRTLRTPCG